MWYVYSPQKKELNYYIKFHFSSLQCLIHINNNTTRKIIHTCIPLRPLPQSPITKKLRALFFESWDKILTKKLYSVMYT